MKTVVSVQDLLEYEIRPGALLDEYHRLSEAAVRAWPAPSLRAIACPACGGSAARPAFERFGLAYQECDTCGSVYLSPRPDARTLADHARSSPAAEFWRERILPETEAARRDKILQPRSDWVRDAIAEYAPEAGTVLDLSPYALPDAGMEPVHAITAFEVFDRAPDVPALVAAARAVLRPGGLFFVTAPTISGFELQALWERARSIAPPEKINLLSIRGFMALFAEGWEIVELSTPGMFDVETVRRTVEAAPSAPWPRIVRALVIDTDDQRRLELQEYLQRARLASFARLIVRRNG